MIPSQLLAPNTTYQLALNVSALDVDGNQIDRNQIIAFTTGAARPLHSWITFVTSQPGGAPSGLWIVNELGYPRQLFTTDSVHSFSWSPGGSTLLAQGDHEVWWELTPGVGATRLGFKAAWASALAAGMGYAFIDDSGTLHRESADGVDEVIATDVTQATVTPDGLRVAFVLGAAGPDEIWGYDVGLRARYELVTDTGPISDVTWSPAANRIAYLRSDVGSTTLRIRNLAGSGATTTIATGDIGAPAWFPDSVHMVFTVAVANPTITHKAFVVNAVAPSATLNLAQGLPADPAVDLSSPIPSPDGHQIAYLSGDQVWLMNADGTRPTPLTQADPEFFPYSCRTPAWTTA
ncbi:MAG: TolB family protein [Candidatus Dormibacterales bacterium]